MRRSILRNLLLTLTVLLVSSCAKIAVSYVVTAPDGTVIQQLEYVSTKDVTLVGDYDPITKKISFKFSSLASPVDKANGEQIIAGLQQLANIIAQASTVAAKEAVK